MESPATTLIDSVTFLAEAIRTEKILDVEHGRPIPLRHLLSSCRVGAAVIQAMSIEFPGQVLQLGLGLRATLDAAAYCGLRTSAIPSICKLVLVCTCDNSEICCMSSVLVRHSELKCMNRPRPITG